MFSDDPFFFWRQSINLSVENAAILMVNGDPTATERVHIGPAVDDFAEQKMTTGHEGFTSALNSITSAILGEVLPAVVKYKTTSFDEIGSARLLGLKHKSGPHVVNFLLRKDGHLRVRHDTVEFTAQPDWSASKVEMVDLRNWLKSIGLFKGVLFSKPTLPYLDPEHSHFSAELDFALTVWQALETETKFKSGTRGAISKCIDQNSHLWRGEKSALSNAAKERIGVIVNWRKSGALSSNS